MPLERHIQRVKKTLRRVIVQDNTFGNRNGLRRPHRLGFMPKSTSALPESPSLYVPRCCSGITVMTSTADGREPVPDSVDLKTLKTLTLLKIFNSQRPQAVSCQTSDKNVKCYTPLSISESIGGKTTGRRKIPRGIRNSLFEV